MYESQHTVGAGERKKEALNPKDREAAVVRMGGVVLLEVEDEVRQVNEEAKGSVDRFDQKSHVLSLLFWHIPVDVRLGEGGCREDFRPGAETRATRTEEQCATLHT